MAEITVKEQLNPWKKSVYIFTNRDREGNFWILEWRKDGRIVSKKKEKFGKKQEIWRDMIRQDKKIIFEGLPSCPHIKRTGRKKYKQERTKSRMTWIEYQKYVDDRFANLGRRKKRMLSQTFTAREYLRSLGIKLNEVKITTPYIKRAGYQPTEIKFKTKSEKQRWEFYKLRRKLARGGYNVKARIDTYKKKVISISAVATKGEKSHIVIMNKKGKVIENRNVTPAPDVFEQAYINLQQLTKKKREGKGCRPVKIQPPSPKTLRRVFKGKMTIIKGHGNNRLVILKDSKNHQVYRRYFPKCYDKKQAKRAIEKMAARKHGAKVKW